MTKNYKLNYNQYKHLIDVFTTGDFLNESLDKPVGLITYRRLLTEDNILYFTQNTKRTCRISLGVQKVDDKLKFIDIMGRGFTYRHSDTEILDNFVKLTLCCLMQNYNPSEYEVYYDLDLNDFEGIDNFHMVSNLNDIDNIYTDICTERHRKYLECGVPNYKEFRKLNKDKLVIFILTKTCNIKRLSSISANHLRYGIAIINLENSDIENNSTVSLNNTIRPNIDETVIAKEIKIYKRMLGECNNMINKVNVTDNTSDNVLVDDNRKVEFVLGDIKVSSYEDGKKKFLHIKVPSYNTTYYSLDKYQLNLFSECLYKKLIKSVKLGVFTDIKCTSDGLIVTLDSLAQPRGVAFLFIFLFPILESSNESFKVISMIPNRFIDVCEKLLNK